MPNIGPLELVIILVIVLIIFGARRIPEVGRSLGTGMREFKDGILGKGGEKEAPAAPPAELEPPSSSTGEAKPEHEPPPGADLGNEAETESEAPARHS